MILKYVATVGCDHEDGGILCPAVARFEKNPSGYTLEEFGGLAKAEFRSKGWRCCEPYPNDKCLCPQHNPSNQSVYAQAASNVRDDMI